MKDRYILVATTPYNDLDIQVRGYATWEEEGRERRARAMGLHAADSRYYCVLTERIIRKGELVRLRFIAPARWGYHAIIWQLIEE